MELCILFLLLQVKFRHASDAVFWLLAKCGIIRAHISLTSVLFHSLEVLIPVVNYMQVKLMKAAICGNQIACTFLLVSLGNSLIGMAQWADHICLKKEECRGAELVYFTSSLFLLLQVLYRVLKSHNYRNILPNYFP